MKRKIHIELLATSALAILLTLIFTLIGYYGLFQEQVVSDLKSNAWVLKNARVFEGMDPEALEPFSDNGFQPDSIRVTVMSPEGEVLFDSDADKSIMDSHENRPEFQEALTDGEGSGSRRSETLDKKLFYYAVKMDDGNILRISKEAKSFFAMFQSLLPMVLGVAVFLAVICIGLANYFTKSLVRPIEQMAENISDPETEAVYKELAPFMATIRQQHEDIMKGAKMRQEFTANVSHELKTPLTAISGYAELIEHGMAGKDDTARFAGEIHKNAARLLTLINDIIQLSQLDDDKRELEYTDVDLYRLAGDCIGMLKMNAQKQNVTMQLCGAPAVVRADKQLMEELLYNLCDNAIRYNNRGGHVLVTVDHENGHAFLSVKDTGIGIPAEHQERIFERFYRVDKSRSKATGGTGLGLAIVKHIVSQHDAKISLKSEAGKGTEIKVVF